MLRRLIPAGQVGDSANVPQIIYGPYGEILSAVNVAIAIPESAVTGLTADLALKAPLASPALTGTPTAPTPSAGDNSTKIATTAYVDNPQFVDSTFKIVDDGDHAKVLQFQCSGITTLTTRTLTVPDASGTIMLTPGAWNTSWTPTISQGVSTNVAKTVSYAAYLQLGKLVMVQYVLAVTGTGTAGSHVNVDLPVTPSTNIVVNQVVGNGHVKLAGTVYPAQTQMEAAATAKTFWVESDITGGGVIGSSPSAALANGDFIRAAFFYEAA